MRPSLTDYNRFRHAEGGSAETEASPPAVWRVLEGIGGENRYFALDALWTLREAMDAAVGGAGLKRFRSNPHALAVGDRIDSWTVLAVEAERRLALMFGMKAPGTGVLEFLIDRPHRRTRLTATAFWEPRGIAGWLYWKAMEPAHGLLFARMTGEIARRAEAMEAQPSSNRTQPI
jgi:hypothetical protein